MNRNLSEGQLKGFLRKAGMDPTTECEVRRIGTDDEMVRAIIDLVAIGEKTMTYSLQWIAEHECRCARWRPGGRYTSKYGTKSWRHLE